MPDHPSRRALLVAVAIAGVSGCTRRSPAAEPSPTRPGVPQLTVEQARADAFALRISALALASSWPEGRALAGRIAADHAVHLAALGASAATAAATSSPFASSSPAAVGGTDQLDAEWAAARAALAAGLASSSGGLGLLLVRIAACRASHADLLAAALGRPARGTLTPASPAVSPGPSGSPGPTGSRSSTASPSATASPSPTPSPGSVFASPTEKALNRLLAGEHAAVYAYPIVIARTRGSRRRQAQAGWARHQQVREALAHRLLSAGVVPVQSEPAYAVSPMPTTAGRAEAFAAALERRLAALDADVVATADVGPAGSDRADAADRLVADARSATSWSGRADALPGGAGSSASSSPGDSPSSSG